MSLILCIETATANCSVALAEDGKVIAERVVNGRYSHAEKLNVFVGEVLSEAGKTLQDLDAIAVSSGPGSYTGLRIGLSSAKGFCFALDKPLIAVPTLEAMAYGIKSIAAAEFYCPVIDARRMEVYCAVYSSSLVQIEKPQAVIVDKDFFISIREKGKLFIAGDGAEKCKELFTGDSTVEIISGFMPSANFIAPLAETKWKNKEFENTALSEPFYLKEFQAGTAKTSL